MFKRLFSFMLALVLCFLSTDARAASGMVAVTFHANGGYIYIPGMGNQTSYPMNVGINTTIAQTPPNPTRGGWEFTGWYTSSTTQNTTTQWDFNTTVTTARTLYAGWRDVRERQNVTVNYHEDPLLSAGPPSPVTETLSAINGAASNEYAVLRVPVPNAKDGNALKYWFRKSGGQFTGSAVSYVTYTGAPPRTEDLYARYRRSVYYRVPSNTYMTGTATRDYATNTFYLDTPTAVTVNCTTQYRKTEVVDGITVDFPYAISKWYTDSAYTTEAQKNASGQVRNETLTYNASSYAYVYGKPELVNSGGASVTFKYNNSIDADKTITVYKQSIIRFPNAPTPPTGQVFDGWYINNANYGTSGSYTLKDNETNVTIEARYKRYVNTINVSFDLNGGSVAGNPRLNYYGIEAGVDKVTKPANDPARAGYVFLGWYSTATNKYVWFDSNGQSVFNASDTLKAIYAKEPYNPPTPNPDGTVNLPVPEFITVNYILYAGGGIQYQQSADKGIPFKNQYEAIYGQPSRGTAYRFKGWYYNNKPWDFESGSSTTSINLTAEWTRLFDVRFYDESALFQRFPSVAETDNTPHPSVPIKLGYKFMGWTYGSSGEWDGDTTLPMNGLVSAVNSANPINIYAKWEKLPAVTLIYDNNSGQDGTWPTSESASGNCYFGFPTDARKPGYAFDGWYDAAGKKYDASTPVSQDVTVTAKWVKSAINITFDPNNGDTPISSPEIKGRLVTYPLPYFPPNAAGEVIKSWHLLPDCSDAPVDFSLYVVDQSDTMYGKWGPKGSITITLLDPYGNEIGKREFVEYGDTINDLGGLNARLSNEYKTTNSWFINGEDIMNPAAPITSDMTLTMRVSHTVSFNSNGGSGIAQKDIIRGKVVDEPPVPFRQGYEFEGWFTDSSFTTEWKFMGEPGENHVNQNTTLYAKWRYIPVNTPPVITADTTYGINVVQGEEGELTFTITDDGLPNSTLDYTVEMLSGAGIPAGAGVSHEIVGGGFTVNPDGKVGGKVRVSFKPGIAEAGNSYTLRLTAKDGEQQTAADISLTISYIPNTGFQYTVLALDASGSMNVGALKSGIVSFSRELLSSRDYNHSIAIISFSDSGEGKTLLPFTNDMNDIEMAMDGFVLAGGTNIYAGLEHAKELLDASNAPLAKRVVLFTDGLPSLPHASDLAGAGEAGPYSMDDYLFWRQANLTKQKADELNGSGYIVDVVAFNGGAAGTARFQRAFTTALKNEKYYEIGRSEYISLALEDLARSVLYSEAKEIAKRVTIACPVDVTVSHNGYTLSSGTENSAALNIAPWGKIDYSGTGADVKTVTFYEDAPFELALNGTGEGLMDYTAEYFSGGALTESYTIEDVPVNPATTITAEAAEAAAPVLKYDQHGDGHVIEISIGWDGIETDEPETDEPKTGEPVEEVPIIPIPEVTTSGGAIVGEDGVIRFPITFAETSGGAITSTRSASPNPAAEGDVVTVSAAALPGYMFTNWVSVPSVPFADANALTTEFVMPAEAVVLTANWQTTMEKEPDTPGGENQGGMPVDGTADTPDGENQGDAPGTAETPENKPTGNKPPGAIATPGTSEPSSGGNPIVSNPIVSNPPNPIPTPPLSPPVVGDTGYASYGQYAVPRATAAQNAVIGENSITPKKISFSAKNPTDIAVKLSSRSVNTLRRIRYGSRVLVENTDYFADGKKYTITAEFLASLGRGDKILTFDMDAGGNIQLIVSIK